MTESAVSFERKIAGEEAIVLRDAEHNLDNPTLNDLLDKVDMPLDLFKQLLNQPLTNPIHGEFIENGEKLEDFDRDIIETEIGKIEFIDVKLRSRGINADNIGMHLQQYPKRGFEAILVKQGEAVMRVPDRVVPAGELYARSEEYTDVKLIKGDLMLIPAPTANGWSSASNNFEFRYICLPPWSKDMIASTEPLR